MFSGFNFGALSIPVEFLLGFGTLAILIALLTCVSILRFRVRGQAVIGTVIKISEETDSDDATTYTPLIKFRTRQGVELEHQGTGSSNQKRYAIGQRLPVVYDPFNLKKMQQYGYFSMSLFVPFVFFWIGGLLWLIALCFWFPWQL